MQDLRFKHSFNCHRDK